MKGRGYLRLAVLGLVVGMGIVGILGSGGGGGGGASKAGLSGGGTGGGAGYGGAGGSFSVDLNGGGSGAIELKKTGTVDTSFTLPAMDNYSTGDNPLVVDEDTTVVVLEEGADAPAAGVLYLTLNSSALYISDGNGTAGSHDPVTGIEVQTGKTLTLGLVDSRSSCGFSNVSTALLTVDRDIVNRGTIATKDHSASMRGWLEIQADNYYGFTGSKIDTRGTLNGQNGGSVEIFPYTGFYNRGNIYANGADSTEGDGGDGGLIVIYPTDNPGVTYNSGNIYNYGGKSATGNGGEGMYFEIGHDGGGALYNPGNIYGYGGDGYLNGGDGGGTSCGSPNYLGAWTGDLLIHSGEIDIHGGEGETGTGGSSDDLEIASYSGGDLFVSGTFNLRGGDALAANQDAGNGGNLEIFTNANGVVTGSIETSARVDTSGGNANSDEASTGDGGAGGGYYVYTVDAAADQNITIITPQVDTSGGDGGTGGSGGIVDIVIGALGTGTITVATDIVSDGGDATTTGHDGGNAGSVTIDGEDASEITVDGNINARGGDSFDSVNATIGVGGAVDIGNLMSFDVVLNGKIDASGGNDKNGDDAGVGNNAGSVDIYSASGKIENNGRVYTRGGDGDADGGNGGYQTFISSGSVTNNGTIDTNGGDGTSGDGGNGGHICVPIGFVDNGTIDQFGGSGGTTDGSNGGTIC